MRPLELEFEGLRSYEHQERIDLRGRGLVAVVGPTGAGKSSILEALTFALYGAATFGDRDHKELISKRPGATSMRVSLVFEAAGCEWRVTRAAHKSKTTPPVSRLERLTAPPDAPPFETLDARAAVNARVKELVGLEVGAFRSSVLLPQGRFAELLTASAAERSAVLKGVFALDRLDRMRDSARDERDVAADAHRNTEVALAGCLDNPAAARKSAAERVESLREIARLVEEVAQRREDAAYRAQEADSDAALVLRARTELDTGEDELRRIAAQLAQELGDSERGEVSNDMGSLLRRIAEYTEYADVCRARRRRVEIRGRELRRMAAREAAQGCDAVVLRESAAALENAARSRKAAHVHRERAQEARESLVQARSAQSTAAVEERRSRSRSEAVSEVARDLANLDRRGRNIPDASLAQEYAAAARERSRAARQAEDEAREELARRDAELREVRDSLFAEKLREDLAPGDPCPVCGSESHELDRSGDISVSDSNSVLYEEGQRRLRVAREAREDGVSRLREAEDGAREAGEKAAAQEAAANSAKEALQRYRREAEEVLETAASLGVVFSSEESKKRGGLRDRIAALHTEAEAAAHDAGTDSEQHAAVSRRSERQVAMLEAEAAAAERSAASADAEADEISADVRSKTPDDLPQDLDEAATKIRLRLNRADKLDRVLRKVEAKAAEIGERADALDDDVLRTKPLVTKAAFAAENLQRAAFAHIQQDSEGVRRVPDASPVPSSPDELATLVAEAKAASEAARNALDASAARAGGAKTQAESDLRQANSRLITLRDNAEDLLDADGAGMVGGGSSDNTPDARDLVRRTTAAQGAAEADERRAAADERRRPALQTAVDEARAEEAAWTALAQSLTNGKFVGRAVAARMQSLLEVAAVYLDQATDGRYAFTENFEILDRDAGEARAARTLSGGEAFLASLSLALGLMEVARREGGRLDAFFLDEGFGTLDPETLDSALNLVASASEGRLVVLISHVPEVRDAIDNVLEIHRDENGSSRARWAASAASTTLTESPENGSEPMFSDDNAVPDSAEAIVGDLFAADGQAKDTLAVPSGGEATAKEPVGAEEYALITDVTSTQGAPAQEPSKKSGKRGKKSKSGSASDAASSSSQNTLW